MLVKTRGIVLNYINYNETSVIVKIYTEQYGLQSYIIKGIRKVKSKNKLSNLEHLSLVEVIAHYKNNSGGLKLISDIKSIYHFQSIPFEIPKSSIALFINEILYKTIKEEEKNDKVFDFLFHTIQMLDLTKEKYYDFHLLFMIQFSKYLGFFPLDNYNSENDYFNLNEGVFQKYQPVEANFISPPLSSLIHLLINTNFEKISELNISVSNRRILLEKIIQFYQLHIEGFGKLNALLILKEVLS